MRSKATRLLESIKSILYIEDDQQIAEIICDMLNDQGYITYTALNAEQAKEHINDVSLIVTDGSYHGANDSFMSYLCNKKPTMLFSGLIELFKQIPFIARVEKPDYKSLIKVIKDQIK